MCTVLLENPGAIPTAPLPYIAGVIVMQKPVAGFGARPSPVTSANAKDPARTPWSTGRDFSVLSLIHI